MSHRIDIEAAVAYACDGMLNDPDGRDVETERDDLLAVIYGWQQEIATDERRAQRHDNVIARRGDEPYPLLFDPPTPFVDGA